MIKYLNGFSQFSLKIYNHEYVVMSTVANYHTNWEIGFSLFWNKDLFNAFQRYRQKPIEVVALQN